MGLARRLLPCGMVLAGIATGAAAEDRTGPEFSLTPYLWIAGVSGTFGTSLPGLPTQRVEADFGDVFSHLNAIPVMLAGEVRQGRFGLMADLMAISVEADAGPQPGGEVRLRQVIGSALATWRVLENERGSLDLGLGLRAFGVSTRFALPATTFDRDASWAVPIAGLRYRHDLGGGWGATLHGDIGATSDDNLTWQAFATLDYRLSDATTLRAGYRWLSFEREAGALRQDIGMGGPILGATIRF